MRTLCVLASAMLAMACSAEGQGATQGDTVSSSATTEEVTSADQPATPPLAAQSLAQAAKFERSEPSKGTLVLVKTGETFVLELQAGGLPNGAGTAADCAVTLEGPQDNEGIVRGQVVPSSGVHGDMTAADIGPEPLKVDVLIGPEGAMVTDHGAAAKLCGTGSQLDGFYKRLDTPD